MTDTETPEPDDLDELASTVFDNEATDVERVQAEADPAVGQRIEAFEALSHQVRDVPTLSDETRSALLAGAVSALEPAPAPSAVGSASVTSLERHRTRRATRVHPLAVAAIIVALLAIPAVLIGLNRDSGLYDSATSSGDSSAEFDSTAVAGSGADSDQDASSADPDAEVSGSAEMAPLAPVELGEVASSSELEAAVSDEIDSAVVTSGEDSPTTTTFASTTTMPAPEILSAGCEATIRTQISGLGPLVLSGTVTYQGLAREVYAFDAPGAGNALITIVVVEPDTCVTVVRTTTTPR